MDRPSAHGRVGAGLYQLLSKTGKHVGELAIFTSGLASVSRLIGGKWSMPNVYDSVARVLQPPFAWELKHEENHTRPWKIGPAITAPSLP
jgi:hypothetical protein